LAHDASIDIWANETHPEGFTDRWYQRHPVARPLPAKDRKNQIARIASSCTFRQLFEGSNVERWQANLGNRPQDGRDRSQRTLLKISTLSGRDFDPCITIHIGNQEYRADI